MAGTTVAHVLLAVLAVMAGHRANPSKGVVYAVELIAAPLPSQVPRHAAAEAQPTRREEVAPVTPPKATVPEVKQPVVAPNSGKPLPTRSTEPPLPNEAPSTGQDPLTVKLAGVQSQYPEYFRNIVAQIYRSWQRPPGAFRAEVEFTILRDGSVEGIQVSTPSGNYTFDLMARGAIEAAANRRAFGPLPAGFPGGALPISFSFSPRQP